MTSMPDNCKQNNNGYDNIRDLGVFYPNPDYVFRNLHSRNLPRGSIVTSVDAEWCPVCHSDNISEKLNRQGKPVWVCKDCDYEW